MVRFSLLLVVIGAVFWGTDSLFRRPLSQDFSPITVVFLEHCILSVVLFPCVLKSRRLLTEMNTRDWISLTIIALAGSVAVTSLWQEELSWSSWLESLAILVPGTNRESMLHRPRNEMVRILFDCP